MHARVSTVAEADDIDAGVAHVRDALLPLLRQQKGFAGLTVSTERAARTVAVLTLWDHEADVRASEAVAGEARREAVSLVGGEVSVEVLEVVASAVGDDPPAPGCALRLREVRVAPESADANVAFFKAQVMPQMQATPGFRAVRYLMDRGTGRGYIGVVFSDEAALRAADAGLAKGREEARTTRGVEFGTTSIREVVFVAG